MLVKEFLLDDTTKNTGHRSPFNSSIGIAILQVYEAPSFQKSENCW